MLDSPIQEIKDRLPITEVLADYVQLKKAGTNYKGLCPFHSEKTASFMVSPSKQIWHCFGCGTGGDVFEFIKQIENVEFSGALKILADRAGVQLRKLTAQEAVAASKKDVLYDINKAAADYFAKVLWESDSAKEGLEYLKCRGLTGQTIKNWNLGWAPDDFHCLENYLTKNFSKPDIVLAGLIIKKDNGSRITDQDYFDRFRGRIMFPILNLHGQTVGFTGRLLHEKESASWQTGKYVNSPETPIYNKSQVIYGLFQAKNFIRKEDRAVLVEGNMDVIAAHQAGTQTAIASSGTALSLDQFRILARWTQNLVFALDTDQAGINAAKRALEIALGLGLNVKIVDLEGAKDPDELIKRGIGIWNKKLESARNYVEYFFDLVFAQKDATNVEDKREITKELAPLIYRISDPVTRAHFVRKLSSKLNVAETAIWDIINRIDLPKTPKQDTPSGKRKDRRAILQEQLLGLSLVCQTPEALQNFTPDDFDPEYRSIAILIKQSQKPQDTEMVLWDLLIFSATSYIQEQGLAAKNELFKVAKEYEKLVVKTKMETVADQLSNAEKNQNKDMVRQLSEEFTALSSKLNR